MAINWKCCVIHFLQCMDSKIEPDCPFLLFIYLISLAENPHTGKLYKQKIDLLEKEVKV